MNFINSPTLFYSHNSLLTKYLFNQSSYAALKVHKFIVNDSAYFDILYFQILSSQRCEFYNLQCTCKGKHPKLL